MTRLLESPRLAIGAWTAAPDACRLLQGALTRPVEPKVMDLLMLLASRPGEVFLREDLLATLWPGLVVGEDTLARSVFKLRRALGDDPRRPTYVETIAKRGYRLIAPVSDARSPVADNGPRLGRIGALLAAGLLLLLAPGTWVGLAPPQAPSAEAVIARAKDHYFQYTREANEAALALYERVLATDSDNAQALAGAASARVQRAVRWPNPPGRPAYPNTTLAEALKDGRTRTAAARELLARARAEAERATALAPASPWAHQALGLVLAAEGDLEPARQAYQAAIDLDPKAWGALINLGDLMDIGARPDLALSLYDRAYVAMDAAYPTEAQRIRAWQPRLGVLIADRRQAAGELAQAERWYRRVLDLAPYEPGAVGGLASLYAASGRDREARALCEALSRQVAATPQCARVLERT